MDAYSEKREEAILLRKMGLTYGEILAKVKIAKSTLSTWLKDVSLAKSQKQRITDKKIAAQKKAVLAVQEKRKLSIENYLVKGVKDIGKLNKRDLFILGIALYWAEGAKQKEKFNVSQCVDFTNSDLAVIKVFLKWLRDCCKITDKNRLKFEIYIHETVGRIGANEAINWWRNNLKISKVILIKVRFKRHKLSNRRHLREYHGQFRIKVVKSTNLNRQIAGWINAVCGIV